MITYINKSNANDYRKLFDKATEVLIQGGLSEDAAQINSLEEYFAQIKTIVEWSNDRRYTILPLDEDVFEIDANKRLIIVPNSFKQNGISVQGDQIAEVIYFEIDRFFDATDLNEMEIYIQWQAPNGDQGISKEWVRDIESKPGKMIFGWPLSEEITVKSGNVKFAVRFVKFGEAEADKNSVYYSFSTLTAEAPIKSSLDFDLKHAIFTPIDSSEILMRRLVNSSADIVGAGTSEIPVVITTLPEIVDLIPLKDDNTKGEFALHVQAQSQDAGAIGYNWHFYPLKIDETTKDYVVSDEAEKYGPGKIIYEKTLDTADDNIKNYYIMIQDEKGKVEIDGKKYRPDNAGEIHREKFIDSGFIDDPSVAIYEKFCEFIAEKAGRYTVEITNKRGKANEAKIPRGIYLENEQPKEETFATLGLVSEILAPKQPEIFGVYDIESDKTTLLPSCIIVEPGKEKPELAEGIVLDKIVLYGYAEASDAKEGKSQMSYQWIKNGADIPNATGESLEVKEEEGEYSLKVLNTRNFITRNDLSSTCRVSYPPTNPSLKDPAIDYIIGEEIDASALIENGARFDFKDGFKYKWYTATSGGKKKLIEGATSNKYAPVELVDHYVEVFSIYNGVTLKEGTMSKAFNIVPNPELA